MYQLPLITPDSKWVRPTELPDLRNRPWIALDTETKDESLAAERGPGWPYRAGYMLGVSWCAGVPGAPEHTAGYAPMRHPDTDNFTPEQVGRWLKDHVDAGVRLFFQNGPYDLGWMFAEWGLQLPLGYPMDDALAMSFMDNENHRTYNLDDICSREGIEGKDESLLMEAAAVYLDPGLAAKGQRAKKFKLTRKMAKANMWRIPARYAGDYATQDAVSTAAAILKIWPRIRDQNLENAYRLEMNLVPVVQRMRARGIRIDVEGTARDVDSFRAKRDALLEEIARKVPGARRRLSMEDLRTNRWMEPTFQALGIKYPRTAGTPAYPQGQASFTKDWMARDSHWLPPMIVKAEQYDGMAEKFLGEYILSFAHRGRVHPEVHQYKSDDGGTVSYRMSLSNPPWQQAPSPDIDAECGLAFRNKALADEGERWYANDYCFDARTEILTEEGWVKFPDLGAQRVAQWEHGAVSFVKPLKKWRGPRKPRTMVHVTGPSMDFRVTSNHRCLFIDETGREVVIEAGAVTPWHLKHWRIPQAGVLSGGQHEQPELVQLVAALQADASDRQGTWRFRLKKPRKLERLLELLNAAGARYRVSPRRTARGRIGIFVDDEPRFREFFEDRLSSNSKDSGEKTFRLSRLMRMDVASRRLFLEELAIWDGSPRAASGVRFGSCNFKNLDIVQVVAACSGVESYCKFADWNAAHKKPFAQVRMFGEERRRPYALKIYSTPSSEEVYCVTVPSGFVICRRDGKIFSSGQSQQEYRLTAHFAALCEVLGGDAAVAAYRQNPDLDYHKFVADLSGLPRSKAKIQNFAILYGEGLTATALKLNMTREEADALRKEIAVKAPFGPALNEYVKNAVQRNGYVKLIDGARCRFDDWEPGWLDREERSRGFREQWAMNPCPRAEAEERRKTPGHPWQGRKLKRAHVHKAMNRLVQGSAARMTKMAMLACAMAGFVPSLQMHDELGFSSGDPECGARTSEIMREILPLRVPMKVDAGSGATWAEAKAK